MRALHTYDFQPAFVSKSCEFPLRLQLRKKIKSHSGPRLLHYWPCSESQGVTPSAQLSAQNDQFKLKQWVKLPVNCYIDILYHRAWAWIAVSKKNNVSAPVVILLCVHTFYRTWTESTLLSCSPCITDKLLKKCWNPFFSFISWTETKQKCPMESQSCDHLSPRRHRNLKELNGLELRLVPCFIMEIF